MTARLKCAHYQAQKDIAPLIVGEKCEAYCYPEGVLMHLIRAQAGRKPCVVTPVGLGTFCDPRVEGCKLNKTAKEKGADIVEVIEIDGREYLMYKTFPINVGLIRATTADENGNLTMEKEGMVLEALVIAQAAKASGGIVIAQVERVAKAGALDPRLVQVPGVVVDYVVKCSDPLKYHRMGYDLIYDPGKAGEFRVPVVKGEVNFPLNEKKVLCRRAAFELVPDAVVNLGIGTPEFVGKIFVEEGLESEVTGSVEAGLLGGVPCAALQFGLAINPESMNSQPSIFDFYDGGGLDLAILGLAELDPDGNVNVSKFGPRVAGCGGFINITQSTKTVVFIGTFTASGLQTKVGDGKITIVQEGKIKKFLNKIEQITFSGKVSAQMKQNVLFVTERAVFRITDKGLTLVEIAPGIDLQKDILDQMEFEPAIAKDLKLMDERIFRDEPMGIKDYVMNKKK